MHQNSDTSLFVFDSIFFCVQVFINIILIIKVFVFDIIYKLKVIHTFKFNEFIMFLGWDRMIIRNKKENIFLYFKNYSYLCKPFMGKVCLIINDKL